MNLFTRPRLHILPAARYCQFQQNMRKGDGRSTDGNRASSKVSHVSVLVGGTEDPKLPAGAVDLALMVNVLSALGNAKTFLGNLAKGLKPDGRLVVIDWDPTKLYPEMAEQEAKSALRQSLRQLRDADFEVVKTLDFLPAQTIWICKRQVRDWPKEDR